MGDWLKRFFSTSNEINENVVIGVVFVIVFIPCIFFDVPNDKLYTLAGLICAFFGLGALKK